MPKIFFKCMGVINITPNSFYGPSQHSDSEAVYQKLIEWKELCEVFDLGAQSTAPQSAPIDGREECHRFATIALPALEKYYKKFSSLPLISIDTYRPETFHFVSQSIRKIQTDAKLIWNDVSGILDQSVFEILREHQNNQYILCHNRVPNREATAQHRDFSASFNENILQEYIDFFGKCDQRLKAENCHLQVTLDINFGFAKSREENHFLLQRFAEVVDHFSFYPWMLGISQKSFLKFTDDDHDHHQRELVHFAFLLRAQRELSLENLLVRVHDPKIVHLANSLSRMQNI